MANFDIMSLGSAMPTAMQGFMQGMDLRQQREDRKNQRQMQDIMGGMLMGTATQEQEAKLAQLNPQAYQGIQQNRQAQQQQALEAQQQQVMRQEVMQAIQSGDRNLIAQMIGKYPQAEKSITAAINALTPASGADKPSSVRETEWFNEQTPEVQATHMKLLRQEKPTFDEQLEYDESKIDLETDAALKKVRDKSQAETLQGYVSSGVSSADNLSTINRSLKLLKDIETGGVDKALFDAKRFFGVESADEAELSYNLGKSVLQQLKPTFGAAFTKNEVDQLTKLESGLGKSSDGNIRILESIQKVIQRATERGLRAANKLGDDFSSNEIQLALDAANSSFEDLIDSPPLKPYTPEQQSIVEQLLNMGVTQEEIDRELGL